MCPRSLAWRPTDLDYPASLRASNIGGIYPGSLLEIALVLYPGIVWVGVNWHEQKGPYSQVSSAPVPTNIFSQLFNPQSSVVEEGKRRAICSIFMLPVILELPLSFLWKQQASQCLCNGHNPLEAARVDSYI